MMIPLIQTLRLIVNPTKFLEDCAAKNGDFFTVKVLGINSPPVVFFSSPKAIADCFSVPAEELDFQKATHVFRPLFGQNSIVLQEGHKHNRQRQLLLPPFHGEHMKTYGQVICRITEEVTKSWQEGASISIQQVMPDITLQIILQVVFGISPGERYQKLKILLSSLLEDITKPFYSSVFFFPLLQKDFGAWSPWGNFLRRREKIDKLIYAEIYERRLLNDSSRTDILSLLMSAIDENGEKMTDIELRDQLVSLLLLGYETTAAVLSWVFYLIHYHRHVKDKLTRELEGLGDEAQPEEKAKLPYLTAICQEALRLHPIALICTPRQVKNTVEIAGQKFTSGTVLVPCIHLAHRRTETYHEPEKFQPERFVNQKFSPFEYLPFGGGYRGCIGSEFSMYELKLIVATILSRFDLTLAGHNPVYPIRRGITIVPSGGVAVIIAQRKNKISGKIALNSSKK